MAKIKTVSLEEFGKKAGEYALDEFEYKGLTIRQWVDKIASGEYQPVKHGRWILCDDGFVRCSECNCKAFIENDETILTDFCHGCGADMRMDGDSE